MASLAPASAPGGDAEEQAPTGHEGGEPVPRTDMTPVEHAGDPGSQPAPQPPRLRVVRLPPHAGE
jgi:hypothetical protein